MIELPHLPVYKGAIWINAGKALSSANFVEATFRGAMGYHLKSLHCHHPQFSNKSDCPGCNLRSSCLYATLFDPPPGKGLEDTTEEIPRPWSISASDEGDYLRLKVTFFGEHLDKFPPFLEAVQELGIRGIGKYNSLFSIEGVEEINKFYLDEFAKAPGNSDGQILLDVSTPMSLRKQGKKLMHWDTDAFVRATLRRIYLLAVHQNVAIPDSWNYQDMVALFENVDAESKSRVQSRSRNSTRQKANIDYSGFTGKVLLKNVPIDGLPIIKAASLLGVGTGTVFGSGRINILG
ncbi:MAG: CRISPR system precrRNA processing endoribonuclease RAMP protein Cas6 [Fibrobacter sp.]|nr:CRISPR system precrRNA processing endoribonuclease RAMP protein Cas6 [Fibrobacter sp.]